MRESRGRTRHTPGREHKTPRSILRREEYEREKERRQSRPRGGTLRVQEEETHILPCYRVVGTGLGTPPEENPKPLEDMESLLCEVFPLCRSERMDRRGMQGPVVLVPGWES
jgi:hypothetical protein